MINFIDNKQEFKKYKLKYLEFFKQNIPFERKPFKENYIYFLGFEFDFIFNDNFFEGICNFLKELNVNNFIYFTTNPSPEKYFYKNFNKYNVFDANVNTSNLEINDILMKDPGDSPSDAIALNSVEIAIFSDSNNWAFLGSREYELGVIGFTSVEIKILFLASFYDNSDMFFSVKEQIDINCEFMDISKSQKEKFDLINRNYI